MRLSFYSILIALLCTISSCVVVPRKYQPNKPFTVKTVINIQGNLTASEKGDMKAALLNQLDDSLKVRSVYFAGIRQTIIKPAVFDTNSVIRSIKFMTNLLNGRGYYEPKIDWDSTLKHVGEQQRVTVNFTVHTGKQLKIDSIAFDLTDTALQRLTLRSINKTLLKKGDPYSKQVVGTELDRLADYFKNHGYYRFSGDNLYAEVDTVAAALIDPNLDPFEQLALLQELRKKRENPTIDIIIRQRPKKEQSLKRYYIRNVSIYPELPLLEDTIRLLRYDTIRSKDILIYTRENKFKPAFLARNNMLKPGKLFRQDNYFKTVSNFSQLGAWQRIRVDIIPDDSAGMLDIVINLYPAVKQSLTIDLEASRNTGDVITSSNLLGFGLNVGLRNINMAREAIETNTNAREGIELGTRSQLIQTFQTSFSHNISMPRFVLPFKVNETRINAARTVLNFNASYTDRRDFFTLGSINGSIGYEWTKRNHSWFYSPLNIELVRLGTTDSLDKLFTSIPNLRFSFNNGLVISQFLVYKTIQVRGNKTSSLKVGLEESGALAGLFKYVDTESGLYRYVKMDIDFRHLINFDRAAWAFRAYGGMGIPYGRLRNGGLETSLPFFKSFVAGGPNSMRGWQVRRLGLGSSNYFDTLNAGGFDRFGDIQLEGNVEYRFNLFSIKSMKVKSALFTDIGNIWYRSNPSNNPALDKAVFRFDRLYKDLAVDGGTGLRFDFEYFLIRFDWSYKLKNPVHAEIDDGWFYKLTPGNGQFQLGINYPF